MSKPEKHEDLPVPPPADAVAKPSGGGSMTDHMSNVSRQIREAIAAAFPAPYNQHLTVMVPGKVVNFGDFRPSLLSQ